MMTITITDKTKKNKEEHRGSPVEILLLVGSII